MKSNTWMQAFESKYLAMVLSYWAMFFILFLTQDMAKKTTEVRAYPSDKWESSLEVERMIDFWPLNRTNNNNKNLCCIWQLISSSEPGAILSYFIMYHHKHFSMWSLDCWCHCWPVTPPHHLATLLLMETKLFLWQYIIPDLEND